MSTADRKIIDWGVTSTDNLHIGDVGGRKLDLGSGSRPREGFQGVDIANLPGVVQFDLTSGQRWPWPDGTVDELCSSHFIEHIATDYVDAYKSRENGNVYKVQKDRLLFFFDEAFRVIKPGGLFHLAWPALKSDDAFRDPTHRRFIPYAFTHYLSRAGRSAMALEHYEVDCNWLVVEGSVQMHLASPRPDFGDGEESGGIVPHEHFWEVGKAVSLTLRAEK